MSDTLKVYIQDIPKAELHVHIEGTLEPTLMFKLAQRNGINIEGSVESHIDKRKSFKVSAGVSTHFIIFHSILFILEFAGFP